ncbi:MAG TPA: hypothetical protein CFH82_07390 [Sulfurospirillum sp. UBA12182]|nr:MAG TPA: hypothetical protein CFH82_07390 [Sulfurospirillum sp. UBA12182]
MNDLVEKLKSMKNATASQYDKTIKEYASKQVQKELKEAGISKEDMSQEEYEQLLEDKYKEAKSFSKGAMVAGGFLLFLELLG